MSKTGTSNKAPKVDSAPKAVISYFSLGPRAELLLLHTTLRRLPLPTKVVSLSCGYLRDYLAIKVLQPTTIPPCFLANIKAKPCRIKLVQLLPTKDAWD